MVSLKVLETTARDRLQFWLKKFKKHPELKKRVLHQAPGGRLPDLEVDMSVCSAPRMISINKMFRKKRSVTDVLSFPADRFFQEMGLLGDLVICGPVLLKQAREQGHEWKDELDVLIVHGLLHLFHFDHEKGPKEAKKMLEWETKLLGKKKAAGLIHRTSLAVKRPVAKNARLR
jgi:probable rRNA maturation factor